jgi:hypothetical protein
LDAAHLSATSAANDAPPRSCAWAWDGGSSLHKAHYPSCPSCPVLQWRFRLLLASILSTVHEPHLAGVQVYLGTSSLIVHFSLLSSGCAVLVISSVLVRLAHWFCTFWSGYHADHLSAATELMGTRQTNCSKPWHDSTERCPRDPY